MLMGAPRDWDRRGEALVVYAMLAFVPVAMILAGSREGWL